MDLVKTQLFHHVPIDDTIAINYEGKQGKKMYAMTITSRRHYLHPEDFRIDLYNFLHKINFGFRLTGVMEFKNKSNAVHAHGIAFANPAIKGNKDNEFTLKMVEIKDLNGWVNYCTKDTEKTQLIANENRLNFYRRIDELHRMVSFE